MPTLAGYDGPVHDRIHEALKALSIAQDAYTQAVANIERQYLRPLESSHDKDGEPAKGGKVAKRSPANTAVLDQVARVRAQFTQAAALDMGHQPVKARFA